MSSVTYPAFSSILPEDRPAEGRQLRFLELLAASAADLLEADDLPATLDRLFRTIRTELRLDLFAHYAFDDNEDEALGLLAHAGLSQDEALSNLRVRLGDEINGRVARDRKPLIANDVQESNDPHEDGVRRMGIGAYVCLPLIHTGRLLGTIAFARRTPRGFDEHEISFLTTLAAYVALAKHRIVTDHALRLGIEERERLMAERMEMEREAFALSRMGALGTVAATIAHELNQPLSAASNYLSAIRLDPNPIDDRTRDRVRAAEAQLQRAGEIIRRIRRMIAHDDLTIEDNALAPIVAEAINLVSAARLHRLPSFKIDIAEDAQHARFDRVQIVQVLGNLLRNAAEATTGAREPVVVVQSRRADGDETEIRVIDNGPGIPREVQSALFQPLLGQSRKGMGLGLAISRSLVEAHGGRIRIEDTPGGGATFCFTIPTP